MGNLSYIIELTDGDSDTDVFFRDFLLSESTRAGEINQQRVSFILGKYRLRRRNIGSHKVIYGELSLRRRLMKLDESDILSAFSLKNDCYVGECFIFNGCLTGYTLMEKGREYLKKGLWLDDKEIT